MDSVENPNDIESGSASHEGQRQPAPEDLLAAAVSLLKQGRLEEADLQARNALEANGDGFEVQRTLGMIAREARRPKNAAEHFRSAARFSPLDAGNWYDVAQQSRDGGDYDEAVSAYSAALELKPDMVTAHRGLALTEQARGNDQAALEHFGVALSLDDKHSVTHLGIAYTFKKLGRPDEAARSAQDAIACDPRMMEAHRFLALLDRDRGDHEAALAEFVAARDLAPRNVWLHLDVATELRALGRLDEAEASCREAVTLEPDFAAAHRMLGFIARDRQDHLGAIAHFETARQHSPTDHWNVLNLANEFLTLARHDEALALYHAALDINPDFAEPYRQIGIVERARGDREAALAAFAAARDLAPDKAWFHYDVSTALRDLGRLDEAEASGRRILEFAPDFVAAHRTLGLIARDRGDHQAALAHFEEARQHAPSDHWNILETANEYRTLEQHDEAIAQYRAALALKSDFPEAYRQIGTIERARGDREAALVAFMAARDLAPDNAWFHLDVVTELRLLGRLDEAEATCRRILEFAPDFVGAHRALGYIARDRKDHEAAIAAFQTARQYSPGDHWIVAEIASDYRTLERFDEAVAHYYAALALKPDFPEPHRQIGTIERMRGNEAAAIGHFEVALFHLERAATKSDARALLGPIELLLLLERFNEAEDRLLALESLTQDPDLLLEAHSLRAQISGKKRDFVSELFHRREMARLRPNRTWIWLSLVEKQIALNMPGAALVDIDEALAHLPNEQDLLIERAHALRLMGRTDEAVMQLRDISPDQRMSASTYMRLANEFRGAGMVGEARTAAENAVRVAPHFAWAHLTLAFTILEHEGPAAGMEQFKRELDRSPDNVEAMCQVSRLLRESGDAAAARDFLLERGAGVMSPLRVFDELIVCLCQCDELDRATELVTRRGELALAGDDLLGPAIEIELSSGDSRKLAALVAKAQENPAYNPAVLSRIIRGAHVLNDLETVIKTNRAWMEHDQARALQSELGIAEAEFRLGHRDQALAILSSLKQRFGDFQDLYLTTARIFKASGKLRAASACLQLGLQKFPNHIQLWEEYVRLCIQTDKIDTARSLLASVDDGNYMLAVARDLLDIELDLELRDIDGSLWKIERFNPRYLRHRAQYHTLCFRAYLGALDLASARLHLSADIAIARFDRKLRRQSRNVSQSLMGQILDDYRLDQGNVKDLIAIGKLPPSQRTDRLFDQVRLNPGSTATAITTLVHLRQAGAFGHPAELGPSVIPKRIAQFWDSDDVPADVAKYMQSWRDNNKDWDYELFNSTRAGEFIGATCSPDVVTAYHRSTDATTKADLFRLAWLTHRGGFYVDADDVSTGPIEDILAPGTRLVAHQEDIGSFGNNFMGSVEGHPVTAAALEEATESILRGDRDMVWLSTGPGMMSRVFTQWLAAEPENRAALGNAVTILDRGELTRVCAAHCQAAYKLTPLHWARGLFG